MIIILSVYCLLSLCFYLTCMGAHLISLSYYFLWAIVYPLLYT